MDTWNEKQLKLMALGGNQKMREFFQNYDLSDESIEVKYGTRAADFYRLQLRSTAEGIPFNEPSPNYEEGEQQLPEDARIYNDVSNTGSETRNEPNQDGDMIKQAE